MFQLVGYERDHERSRELSEQLKAVRGSGGPTTNDLINAGMAGDSTLVDELIGLATQLRATGNMTDPIRLATWAGDLGASERAARLQIGSEVAEVRAWGHRNLASLLVMHGRWTEASAQLDATGVIDPDFARTDRAIITTQPLYPIPRRDLERAFEEMQRWTPDPPQRGTPPVRAYEQHVRLYYLGLLASKLGDRDAALDFAGKIEDLPDVADTSVPGDLAATIRADVAWRSGEGAGRVLEHLAEMSGFVPAVFWDEHPFAGEHARFLRVLAFHETGRDDEALRWLENSFVITPGWIYNLAPVAYLESLVLTELGRAREAAAARAEYESLWSGADTPISLPGS